MGQKNLLHSLNLDVRGETILTSNGSIDLYTQREPYSGRGAEQLSDAFAPQELVTLYAHVTYNLYPVQNITVLFQMIGPPNPIYNFSSIMSSQTNASGIAQISFRIPWPDEDAETQIFGNWTAIATVDIAEQIAIDTLTFQVGWIVRLLSVETVDVNNVFRTSFTKGERVHFKLMVRNIAMTDKVATLIVDAYDNSSVPLGQLLLEDVWMSPGVNVLFAEDLLIPAWACLGESLVVANACTELPSAGGESWCPQVLTTFLITKLISHDVAVVSVVPLVTKVVPCDIVYIRVIVRNEGDKAETFNITTYYNENIIDTKLVANLHSYAEKALMFAWSTCVPVGNYTIAAVASIVPGETDVKDNTFIDGVVWVTPWVSPSDWEIPRWLLALLFLLIVFVGACLIAAIIFALLWRRKKKKNGQTNVQPTHHKVGFKRSKTCNVCEKEFHGVYTFCPYCLTFHRKDYE